MCLDFIMFDSIFVTVFPAENCGYISVRKTIVINGKIELVQTKRKVDFLTAIHYMIKHNMKMEQSTEFKDLFTARKKRKC